MIPVTGQISVHGPAVLILLLLVTLGYTVGRRHCYSCSTLEIGSTCLQIPANVTEGRLTVPCKYYCTIWRQQYLYSPESLGHFVLNRSCEKMPLYLNRVETDDYFVTHYRSCRSHLCNFGDGLERIPLIPGEEEEEDEEDGAPGLVTPHITVLTLFLLSTVTTLILTSVNPVHEEVSSRAKR